MKLAVVECGLKLAIMMVYTGDSIDACDSKTVCNSALFTSTVTGGFSELAIVEGIGGCEIALLGVRRLVWARTTSSVCPVGL